MKQIFNCILSSQISSPFASTRYGIVLGVFAVAAMAGACDGATNTDANHNNHVTNNSTINSVANHNNHEVPVENNQNSDNQQHIELRFEPFGDDFFDVPMPNDIRLVKYDGPGFLQWPGAASNPLLKLWFETGDELLDGWGVNPGVFSFFTGPLDTDSFPNTFEESLNHSDEWPGVVLINVDQTSANKGQILPIKCKFTGDEGTFHAPNQLACITPMGVVKRPRTKYALVYTSTLRDSNGNKIVAPKSMIDLMRGESLAVDTMHIDAGPYTEALAILDEAGLSTEDVVALNIFTTTDPAERLVKINQWYDQLPQPEVDESMGWNLVEVYDDYIVLEAYYDVPVIQSGNRPYDNPPSGKIIFGDDGSPQLQDTQSIRFYVTVPRQPMPDDGFPALIYMHGSGGNAEELLDRGPRTDADVEALPGTGPAAVVAPYGIGGFAADFNLHGMRHNPPDRDGLKLYNLINNPRAAVDNFLIAANEVTLHSRLLSQLKIDPAIAPEYLDAGNHPDGMIFFDAHRIAAMGQSMGSTIGLPALTIDKITSAGIFTGSGGMLVEIALESRKPFYILPILRGLLGYKNNEVMDEFDPILHAVQHVWDLVEPLSHGRHLIQSPHDNIPPKHALQHSGIDDSYFTYRSRAAFSAAVGLPLVEPVVEDDAFEIMQWTNLHETLSAPVQGNTDQGTTGLVAQYLPEVLDGHNIAFQREDTQWQYACFIHSLNSETPPVFRDVEQSKPENCP